MAETAAPTCSGSSLAAAEPLGGSATQARRWLLVEASWRWERDVEGTTLPDDLRRAVDAFDGRVQLIRRPDRRAQAPRLFLAETRQAGGDLWTARVDGDEVVRVEPLSGPLVLVCCHGRRDPCCARLGTPVYEALAERLAPEALWQSSHLGGHRFAANVLVLPAGVLLGRVSVDDADAVAAAIADGLIPLAHYRGRTMHAPEAQAADAAVRARLGLAAVGDVSVAAVADGAVRLETPRGAIEARVETEEGPPVATSCGDEPTASVRYSVRW